MTTPTTTREIQLAARPAGEPTESSFQLAEVELSAPAPDQLLVRNLVMSVDPYMRGRMYDVESFMPPFQLGKALEGAVVGEVVESRAEGFAPGDLVLHMLGWREHAIVPAGQAEKIDRLPGTKPSAYLGVLGMPGLTAYVGLLDIAAFQPGETVFVSSAAGAVGSLVGELAKLRGAKRVIGSAGSAEKVKYLTEELGFDAAFNYRDGDVSELLAAAAPEGIDVYFDNVGGDHLEAALDRLNLFGRIAACGTISHSTPASGPRNLKLVLDKRLTLRGLLVSDHDVRKPDFLAEVGPAVVDGRIKAPETVLHGVENAPRAFLGLMHGANTGKMIVELGKES